MRICLFIALISFFFTKISFSQNCDTVLIKKLYKDADMMLPKDIEKSYHLALEAYSQSKECTNSKHYFKSIISLCNVY